jgi:hypothetical protein
MDWRVAQIGAEIAQYGPRVQRPRNPYPTSSRRIRARPLPLRERAARPRPNHRPVRGRGRSPSPNRACCTSGEALSRKGRGHDDARCTHVSPPPFTCLDNQQIEIRSRGAPAPEFCSLQPRDLSAVAQSAEAEARILGCEFKQSGGEALFSYSLRPIRHLLPQ